MNKVKRVLLTVVSLVCVAAVLTGGVWCSRLDDTSACNRVDVVIEDSLVRSYVDADELVSYLQSRGCYSVGKQMEDIDCHAIEQTLLKHDMVRTVSCYKTPFGGVSVSVTQRVPMLAVKSNGHIYLVDTDRRVMPCRAGMDKEVVVLTGNVGERAAQEEYYDFVAWIKQHDYWRSRLKACHVANPRQLVLSQYDYKAKIILGPLDGYETKMNRLQRLYTKGFDVLGYPECKELDLRYEGQVIKR
ncbi:MAG: hypothetical protein J6R26_04325 [Paludibacteraceae bacterium]|nr:hypothetical protein [Paludibacteraceae bacterium]